MSATACGDTGGATSSSAGIASDRAATSEPTTATTSSVIPQGQPVRGDGDADNPNDVDGNGDSDAASVGGADEDNDSPTRVSYDFPDADDKATFAYGHSPSAAVRRVLSRVVKRYYAAAAAGDGITACSMLISSLVRSAPADYGGRDGPPYLHGAKTCAAVLSALFAHFRGELAEAVTVVEIRMSGRNAQVVLSSRKMRASRVFLERQGRSWKLPELLGQPLP